MHRRESTIVNNISTGTFESSSASVGYGAWLAAAGLSIITSAFYLVNLDRPENPDELYHMLAARGFLETGEPRIADGYYWRAFLFTRLVALSFAIFGEGLWSARLPSALATAILVGVMFLWVSREVGPRAAWIAAGLYAMSPFAVSIGQFCRFYAVQTLAFTFACWLVYDLIRGPSGLVARVWRATCAAALLGLAAHLQETTLIGMAGLSVWIAGATLVRLVTTRDERERRKIGLLAGAFVASAGVVVAIAWDGGWLGLLWERYRATPMFNMQFREQFWFYHQWYIILYPTLWTLTAPLMLVAFVHAPGMASMLATTFGVAFVITSFGGSKSLRYFAYAQPLLFMMWGIATAALWKHLRCGARWSAENLADTLKPLGRAAETMARVLVVGAVFTVVVVNPFWLRTFGLMANVPIGPEVPDADWRKALPVLAPLAAEVSVVVDGEELAPLYYLGRHDILFSPSKFHELPEDERRDFGRDVRTGRPIIASHSALEKVLRCYPSGLFLVPRMHWNRPSSVDAAAIELIERYASPVALPEDSHVFAYIWRHEKDETNSEECAALPSLGEFESVPKTPRLGGGGA